MNDQQATVLVPAPLHVVRQALLDPLALAEWNPAFLTIKGSAEAAVGVRYPITTRGGLRGYFEYLLIETGRIDTAWRVPGLAETGTWRLEAHGASTLVVHGFQHQGPLARVLRFDGVAQLRLDRLAQRVQTTHAAACDGGFS